MFSLHLLPNTVHHLPKPNDPTITIYSTLSIAYTPNQTPYFKVCHIPSHLQITHPHCSPLTPPPTTISSPISLSEHQRSNLPGKVQFPKLTTLTHASPLLLSDHRPSPNVLTSCLIGHHVAVDATWFQEAILNFEFPPTLTLTDLKSLEELLFQKERMPTRGVIWEPFLPSHGT